MEWVLLPVWGFWFIWSEIGRIISFGNDTILVVWSILGLFVLLGLGVLCLGLFGYTLKRLFMWIVNR